MLNLIKADVYRLARKKSICAYAGALTLLYVLLSYIRSSGFREGSVINDAATLLGLLPALAGGMIFSAVYLDELSSKNLSVLVGFGLARQKIVLAKLIVAALCAFLPFGLFPLFHSAVYALMAAPPAADQLQTLYTLSLKYLLLNLAYTAISGIAAFGTQRSTVAIVSYILLALGIAGAVLTAGAAALDMDISPYLPGGLTGRIMLGAAQGGPLLVPAAAYAAWLSAAVFISFIVFDHKEMEF